MVAFSKETYISRRKKLKETLGSGQILLIGNQETGMNFMDNWYHFRQDSTLLYYTGIDKPDVHLLIDVDADEETIYGDELSIDDVIWTGPLPSLVDIAAMAGIDMVRPSLRLKMDISTDAMYLPPYRAEHHILLYHLLGIDKDMIAAGVSNRLIFAIIAQRNYKDAVEVEQMNEAVRYSYDMHLAVMKNATVGMHEHDLVAIASSIAYQHNTTFAYPAILTKRGEVLHNHDHNGLLYAGDMVLYDGGCESGLHYAGDITRTFPIGGKWSPLQKDIYDIVYAMYKQSVDALRPGVLYKDIHLLACRVLANGLKDIGFIKGNVDDAVANGAHTMFFQHGLGHLIGLDVHDMENLGELMVGYSDEVQKSTTFGFKSLRLGRRLEKGFALTVEPGIYMIPELIELRKSQGLYKDYINYNLLEKNKDFGGIRLEDNFIITKDGSMMLGGDVTMPRTSSEVEEFMR